MRNHTLPCPFFCCDVLLSEVSQLSWRSAAEPRLLLGEFVGVDLSAVTEVAPQLVACRVWFASPSSDNPTYNAAVAAIGSGARLTYSCPHICGNPAANPGRLTVIRRVRQAGVEDRCAPVTECLRRVRQAYQDHRGPSLQVAGNCSPVPARRALRACRR